MCMQYGCAVITLCAGIAYSKFSTPNVVNVRESDVLQDRQAVPIVSTCTPSVRTDPPGAVGAPAQGLYDGSRMQDQSLHQAPSDSSSAGMLVTPMICPHVIYAYGVHVVYATSLALMY